MLSPWLLWGSWSVCTMAALGVIWGSWSRGGETRWGPGGGIGTGGREPARAGESPLLAFPTVPTSLHWVPAPPPGGCLGEPLEVLCC